MQNNYKHKKFPDLVPLFPLPGALLLPNSKLPLNIFEPRYLEMVEDVLKSSFRFIGMIQPQKRKETKDGKSHLSFHRVGCVGRISSFSETEDGRYLITLEGASRFEFVETIDDGKPYITGRVNWEKYKDDLVPSEVMKSFDRKEFLVALKKYFDSAQISSDWEVLKEAEVDILINSLAMLCPFDPEEKQVLLEAETLLHRKAVLLTLMKLSSGKSVENEYVQ
jgi:Lon protease-like protein